MNRFGIEKHIKIIYNIIFQIFILPKKFFFLLELYPSLIVAFTFEQAHLVYGTGTGWNSILA